MQEEETGKNQYGSGTQSPPRGSKFIANGYSRKEKKNKIKMQLSVLEARRQGQQFLQQAKV
jgi:hypothetical protein